jgi:hypothetical protein
MSKIFVAIMVVAALVVLPGCETVGKGKGKGKGKGVEDVAPVIVSG